MALPSSPPLLPDVDLPAVPLWPSAEDPDDAQPAFAASRKRPLSDYGSLSSDPIFSEEPSEADATDYDCALPRRKRWVQGPWWNQRRRSGLGLRRTMARRDRRRPADSGVWMGSDASEDSVDSILSGQERLARFAVKHSRDGDALNRPNNFADVSESESEARAIINACLESGKENVDLSLLRLTTLSSETLRPLHQLIRNLPTDKNSPPSEEEFNSLTPAIQLYLFGNELSSLPPELFNLNNLTVLSLRNNRLSFIPPAIGRLRGLRELNIAQNNIRFLPWELFDLVHARDGSCQITFRPNPFVKPAEITEGFSLPTPGRTPAELIDAQSKWGEIDGAYHSRLREWYRRDGASWGPREELEVRLRMGRTRRMNHLSEASRAGKEVHLSKEPLIFLASSPVRFFDVDGSPSVNFGEHTKTNTEHFAADLCDTTTSFHGDRLRSVPSLFELCLRSCQSIYTPAALRDPPEPYSNSASVSRGLRIAADATDFGIGECTSCGNGFVIARAEWVEYWFNGLPSLQTLTEDTILPFMRRACSWRCAVPSTLGAFRF